MADATQEDDMTLGELELRELKTPEHVYAWLDSVSATEVHAAIHATLDTITTLRAQLATSEERAESAELGCEIAYQREPTQAEGDAHEAGEPAHAKGECFVPMGGWTGRRCIHCSRWVWGGPTAHVECADLADARARIERDKDAYAVIRNAAMAEKERADVAEKLAESHCEIGAGVRESMGDVERRLEHAALDLTIASGRAACLERDIDTLRAQLASAEAARDEARNKLDSVLTAIAEATLRAPDAPVFVEYDHAGKRVKHALAPHAVRGLAKAIDIEARKIAGTNSYERVAAAEDKLRAAESALATAREQLGAVQADLRLRLRVDDVRIACDEARYSDSADGSAFAAATRVLEAITAPTDKETT